MHADAADEKDWIQRAIGGTSNEEGDGVQAALVTFRFLAHALWTTEEALAMFADLGRATRFNLPAT